MLQVVQADVRTVPPPTRTGAHDFLIKEDGNYILMAYEPATRDLSGFQDANGELYSMMESTRDLAIQERTAEGTALLTWNSWDYLAIDDCTEHFFPDDYAPGTGEPIWLLGKSNKDWSVATAAGRGSGSGGCVRFLALRGTGGPNGSGDGVECDRELCRALTGEQVDFADTSTGPAASRRWEFGEGSVQDYRNEPGLPAPAITDGAAFPGGCRR